MTHVFNDDWKVVLAALESGEYEQCKGALHNGHEYCCLGVMSKVLLGDPEIFIQDDGKAAFGWEQTGEFAPASVEHRLGLRSVIGDLSGAELNGKKSLADANDAGATFAEIAAFIREHPYAVSKRWRAEE